MNSIIIILILVLFSVYLYVGISSGKVEKEETFLISNRTLSGVQNGFSIAASKIGGGLLVVYSTFFFKFGWSAFFYFIGIMFGYILFYRFAKKLHVESKEKDYYTLADFFASKYGVTAKKCIGIITTLSVFGWVLTNLISGGYVLAEISGFSPYLMILSISIVIGVYLIKGGFNAVVKTDWIQFCSLIIIMGIFAFILFYKQDDFRFIHSAPEDISIGQIIGFFVLGIFFPMGSAELWQRVYAANDLENLKKSIKIASLSYLILGVFISVISLAILAGVSDINKFEDGSKLVMGVVQISENIHPILPGIWLIAFMSAIISSADTFVYSTASAFVQDVLILHDKKKTVKAIKQTIIGLLILASIIGGIYPNIIDLTILFVGITLVLAVLSFFASNKSTRYTSITFCIAGGLGICAVFTHFALTGGVQKVTTSLIGLICSSLVMVFTYVFRERKVSLK